MSDGDELIRLAGAEASGTPSVGEPSRFVGMLVAASLVVLVGTGLIELLAPPKAMGLVGQEAVEAQAAAEERALLDGSWARSIETEFRLRGRVRRAVGPYWSALMYRLGVPPSREVVIGDDGWLFLRSRIDFDASRAERGAATTANLYAAIDRRLGAFGTELVLLPLPRKSVVCSDRLPDGIDPRPELDRTLVDVLRSRGLETVDVLAAWEALEDEEVYLPLDTHWARGGRLAAAKEVARQAPEMISFDQRAWFEETEPKEVAFLLDHLGIFTGHPVRATLGRAEERVVSLRPKRLERRLKRQRDSGDVVLVGSSFSAGFDFPAILVTILQAEVVDESQSGQPMFHSLARGIRRRGICRLPRVILSEFPVYQVAGITAGNLGSTEPAAELLLMVAPLEVFPVDPAFLTLPVRTNSSVGQPVLSFPTGSLLSSGDGVLFVELTIESDAPSSWTLVGDAMHFPVEVPAGRETRVIPVIQSVTLDAPMQLVAMDEAAVQATVAARIVTDCSLAAASDFSPAHVGEHDLLAVTWTGKADSLHVIARGRDRDAGAVVAEWSFARPASRIAVVSLARFQGGELDEVIVEGPAGAVTVTHARCDD